MDATLCPGGSVQHHSAGDSVLLCDRGEASSRESVRLADLTHPTWLENGGTIEHAQQIANHESPKTTKLYDRTSDQITLDEVERDRPKLVP